MAHHDLLRAPTASERLSNDVVTTMYPSIRHVALWAEWAEKTGLDDRPMLICEFSHAMGNSNGSLDEYLDLFWNQPAIAGGYLWDWRDQGLAETDHNGRFFWAYGGHFGDEPNDANFCINGLVGPDLVPHPAMREPPGALGRSPSSISAASGSGSPTGMPSPISRVCSCGGRSRSTGGGSSGARSTSTCQRV